MLIITQTFVCCKCFDTKKTGSQKSIPFVTVPSASGAVNPRYSIGLQRYTVPGCMPPGIVFRSSETVTSS